jgi:hypothetical protein
MKRAIAAVGALCLITLACAETPVGVSNDVGISTLARVTLAAEISRPQTVGAAVLPPVNNVRVALVRPPSDTLRDTVIAVAPGQSAVAIDLTVSIRGSEEVLEAGIQLRNGNSILYSGTLSVTARSTFGGTPTTSQPVTITYVGPGAAATRISVEPAQANVQAGAAQQFSAVGFDASNNPVSDLIVSWSSSDPSVATMDQATGLLQAGDRAGTVTVRATSPSGVEGTATVQVVLLPTPTPGADVVVFNDVNIFDNGALSNSATQNAQFVRNLVNFSTPGPRNSGNVVMWDCGRSTRYNACGTQPVDSTRAVIQREGHTLTFISSSSGSLVSIPPNVKTLWLWLPTVAFTNAEINALKQFASEGGRIVFVGEYDAFYGPVGIAVENDFLAKMGAVLRNTGGAVDCGAVVLPESSLRPHQITQGITSLRIGCASVIAPGPDDFVLFYDTNGTLALGGVAKIDLTPLAGSVSTQGLLPFGIARRDGLRLDSPSGH